MERLDTIYARPMEKTYFHSTCAMWRRWCHWSGKPRKLKGYEDLFWIGMCAFEVVRSEISFRLLCWDK
ncbi:hypothetical protein BLA28_21540 [Eisenbergiella tayi]|nr:hypothetical protein BLA28_21540 [Eisenbergiella tayi]